MVMRNPLNRHVNQLLVNLRTGSLCYGNDMVNKLQGTITADRWMKYLHQGYFLILATALKPASQDYLERNYPLMTCNKKNKSHT